MSKPFNTLRIMTGNAWEWLCYDKDGFHSKNAANMKRRNEKLRRLYNLDELEERGNTRNDNT